jgi:hypothetical protein
VFAQEVAAGAEKHYLEAVKSLKGGSKRQAVAELKRAPLQIFPDYFVALKQLGFLYLEKTSIEKRPTS